MKIEHKEVKNPAHCDLGRNGELEDLTLDSAMPIPGRWFWGTSPDPVQATADTPVPTPTSDQPAPWEDWSETDAAKKAMVEDDMKRRRDLFLTLQTDTVGKREKVLQKRQKMKDDKGGEEVTMAGQGYLWVDEETMGSSSTAREEKAKEDKAVWISAWC